MLFVGVNEKMIRSHCEVMHVRYTSVVRQVHEMMRFVCWIAGCRARRRCSRLASTSLSHRGTDEAPAAVSAAAAACDRQWTSQGVHAAAIQLADGNVLGA